MSLRFLLIFTVMTAFFDLSCASGPEGLGMQNYDKNSKAAGAAYRADVMNTRRPMPSHADWRPLDFYYKHCSEIGDESYYSKTSYSCSEPF